MACAEELRRALQAANERIAALEAEVAALKQHILGLQDTISQQGQLISELQVRLGIPGCRD